MLSSSIVVEWESNQRMHRTISGTTAIKGLVCQWFYVLFGLSSTPFIQPGALVALHGLFLFENDGLSADFDFGR